MFYVQSLLLLLMNLPGREFEASFWQPSLQFVSSSPTSIFTPQTIYIPHYYAKLDIFLY